MSSLTEKPARRRKYSQEQKDQFFAVLDRVQNASAAARELGFNVMTCHQWIRKAGLTRGKVRKQSAQQKYTAAQKEQFFALFDRLRSTTESAKELGLNPNTCGAWVRCQ